MVILSLTCTDTRGNFPSTEEGPASLPWHRSFSSIRMREEATARHRRVSPLLPGKSTHTTQAVLIPGQDHTLLPHGTASHCAPYAARVPFDWKSHASRLSMEKLHVSELCTASYPVFLPMHPVWRTGKWQPFSGRKTLWTIVTGIFKELLFCGCCYNIAKWSFLKGFPTEGSVERIHKGEKHSLCVLLANCWQWNVLYPSKVLLSCGCVGGKGLFPAEN